MKKNNKYTYWEVLDIACLLAFSFLLGIIWGIIYYYY